MKISGRRIATGLSAAATVGAFAVVSAPPSSAASLGTFNVDCAAGGNVVQNLTGHVGDTLTVNNTSGSGCFVTLVRGVSGAANIAATSSQVYTITAANSPIVGVGNAGNGTDFYITVVSEDTSAPSASAPTSHLQQVPVPASGLCADVQDADLKWGTDVTGGWTKQWGDWQNDWACSRVLTNAGGTWHAE